MSGGGGGNGGAEGGGGEDGDKAGVGGDDGSNGGRSCCNRAGETEARACRLSVAVLATDFSGRSLTILSTHRPLQVPC